LKKEQIGARSLTRNILGVEGCAGVSGWGRQQVTTNSIIYTDLHNPNNKLVNAWLEQFWCTDEPRIYTNSQDSPQLGLGGSHRLPHYNILYD